MRIAIASAGRFHVLDLARELAALGHKVRFYSYVPRLRALRFGLPRECHVSLLREAAPYLIRNRLFGRRDTYENRQRFDTIINRAVTRKLQPCDLFICMSGIYVEAAEYARKTFGAKIFLERGSTHIEEQARILAQLPGQDVPAYHVERERAGYDLADRIVVPSTHVAESFRQYPALANKIFVNPYGVDLNMFPPGKRQGRKLRQILFVGVWSYQKGCDVLARAVEQLPNIELVHVGATGDAPIPAASWFRHHDPVDQASLGRFCRTASMFVLASRQDGFGLVLGQALASGLPLVCTDRTGGDDLRYNAELKKYIRVVAHDNVDALQRAIAQMLDEISAAKIGDMSKKSRALLSWSAYGKRYDEEIRRNFRNTFEYRQDARCDY